MKINTCVEDRMALYNYFKTRRLAYRAEALRALGSQCSLCGGLDDLRVRFKDRANELRDKYRSNPVTLYRRLCNEPELREQLMLLCRSCRLSHPANSTEEGSKADE
jgi:hypothetical protein